MKEKKQHKKHYRTPPIIDIGGVLVSADIITECFCCDLNACHGACCIIGEAGAPLADGEINILSEWTKAKKDILSIEAQKVIDTQGIAYKDKDGTMVTSIVDGADCIFTYYEGKTCLCALEKTAIKNESSIKPISCALYPIREITLTGGTIGLNYHKWKICKAAIENGKKANLPLYRFLRKALIRRFGKEWYDELELVANELMQQDYL